MFFHPTVSFNTTVSFQPRRLTQSLACRPVEEISQPFAILRRCVEGQEPAEDGEAILGRRFVARGNGWGGFLRRFSARDGLSNGGGGIPAREVGSITTTRYPARP